MILAPALAEKVEFGYIAIADFDDKDIPSDRMAAPDQALDALSGKIDSFSCFGKGLVLLVGDQDYLMNVEFVEGKIRKLSILKAPDGTRACLN